MNTPQAQALAEEAKLAADDHADALVHRDPADPGAIFRAKRKRDAKIDQLAGLATQAEAPAAAIDPMDWPLPCDVTVGHGTMRKGVRLGTLVARMKVLYEMATGHNADAVETRTPEERHVLHDEFLSALAATPPQPAATRVWSSGADDGMRVPELCDLQGGATDYLATPPQPVAAQQPLTPGSLYDLTDPLKGIGAQERHTAPCPKCGVDRSWPSLGPACATDGCPTQQEGGNG